MKALVINLQGMGDILMTTPVIHSLSENYDVDMLIRGGPQKTVLEHNPYVKKIINFTTPLHTLRKINKKYDLVYLANGAGPKSALFFYLIKAKDKACHVYNLYGQKTAFGANIKIEQTPFMHRVEENNKLAKKLKLRTYNTYTFSLDKDERDWIRNRGLQNKKLLGIHPGGDKHNPEKRYPIQKYVSFSKKLPPNYATIFFLGPDEIELRKSLEGQIIATENIVDTAAIIERCELLIHTDSGIGHLAAAVKTPTRTIVGPTNWKRTHPYGNNDKIIKSPKCPGPIERRMEQGFIDKKRAIYPENLTLRQIL